MKIVGAVVIALAIGAIVLTLVGGSSAEVAQSPLNGADGTVTLPSTATDIAFGVGYMPQIRPTEVVVRVTRSDSETIPLASHAIEIYNGGTKAATFAISWEYPFDVWPGFSPPPTDAENWVTFSASEITVPAGEIGVVQVLLKIPPKTVTYDWEFWVGVSQGEGDFQTMICVRWLVEMR